MCRGQHASVSGRRALTARYLSRYARRALVHTSHASACGVSDLQDGTCLGKRNGVRGARGRCASGGSWVGRTQVPEIRVSMARASSARARGTCSCSARQRPAHPNGPTLTELKTASRTLALERKRPVKPTELFELFRAVQGVQGRCPQIRKRPHANCASHACPFRSLLASTAYICQKTPGEPGHTRDTHAGHTGAHGHTDHTDEPSQPTNAPARTTARDRNRGRLNSRSPVYMYKPPCWCRKFRCNSTPGSRLRARVTHPSAALREVAEQRHGKGAHGLVQLALHLRKA